MMVVPDRTAHVFDKLNHLLAHMGIFIKGCVDVVTLAMGNGGAIGVQVATGQIVFILCRGEFVTGAVFTVIDDRFVEKVELKFGNP